MKLYFFFFPSPSKSSGLSYQPSGVRERKKTMEPLPSKSFNAALRASTSLLLRIIFANRPTEREHARAAAASFDVFQITRQTLIVPRFIFLILSPSATKDYCLYTYTGYPFLLQHHSIIIMADVDSKEDKDALDTLELEAKEFDKVRCALSINLSLC